MMNGSMLPVLFAILAMLVFALCKGGAPERWGAGVVMAMAALQLTVRTVIPNYWTIVDVGPLMADTLGFIGFGAIALYAFRVWPLFASALELISLGAHLARWLSAEVLPTVYALARDAPTVLSILMLAGASVSHWLAQGRGKIVPDWQDWNRGGAEHPCDAPI